MALLSRSASAALQAKKDASAASRSTLSMRGPGSEQGRAAGGREDVGEARAGRDGNHAHTIDRNGAAAARLD